MFWIYKINNEDELVTKMNRKKGSNKGQSPNKYKGQHDHHLQP